MSNTNHDFLVKNGLVVGQAITSTGTLTQAGQTFPASDGSAGQYLKTNGSGALSWGTVNTSFNITDGTTTDTVGSTETVTFTGGTNISLAVTDNTVTITNDVVDSDDITEGSSNLFYTDARAIAAIQGASNLTIDGGTLYVDTAADRVGISDTSPQQKLDVAGNIGVNGSEVIDASGNIVGSVADSAMTVGGSLAGVLSNLKVQYGTAYSGTPIQGSFFFDSLNQKLKVYTGSAFIDAVPAGSGGGGGSGATDANTTFRNYSYTLTGTTSAVSGVDDNELTAGAFIIGHKYTITSVGNTDFTAIGASGNTVGVVFTATGVGSGTGQAKSTLFYDTTSSTTRVVAYVNGIKQVYGSGRDFVATTGTSVAFTYNLGSGDTVDIQVYELLTNDAYYIKSEVYTQTEVNSQISTGVSSYLPLAGGTLTGDLILSEGSPTITLTDTDGNTSSHIKTVGSNMELHAQHGNMRFRVGSSGLEHMRIAPGGDITFYDSIGTNAKLFWDASAESLGIGQGVFSSTQALNLKGEGIAIKNDKSGNNDNWSIIRNTAASSTSNISFVSGLGEAMVINHNKRVGIGTDSPSVNLEVSDSGNSFILVKNTSSNSGLYLKADTDGDAEIQTAGGTNDIVIRTSGQERARFKAAGGLAIGNGAGASGHQLQVGEFDTAFTSKPQGQQKLLHIDDSYVMRVAREHGTGDIANIGWYNVAKIPPFGSSGKVTVSIGGDLTSDIVVIEWISSHNTSLNNGMGAPQLNSKSTFANIQWNSDPRISNTRVARDNTTGTYYVQVYVSTGVNNNTEGKSLIEVYQGANLEQDDTNIEAMFTYYSGSPSHYFECPVVRNGTGYTGIHVRHEQPSINLTSSTASTTISQNSTWTKLPMNSERWDVGNFYDHTTQRFTAPTTGKYLFGINLQLENASGIIWTYIVPITNGVKSVTNGNNMADFTATGTYYNQCATWMLNLTAMDYVELWTIGSGGSYNFKGNTESSVFIYLL